MLMCQPCSARRRVRKLKQIGKTQKENSFFLRRYRCLGCGATLGPERRPVQAQTSSSLGGSQTSNGP
jgi:hypothetical protein